MSSCIIAVGTANPEHRIAQDDIYRFMVKGFGLDENQARRLKQIYAHSGIDYRYSVIPDFAFDNPQSFAFFAKTNNLEPFPGTAERQKIYQQKAIDVAHDATVDCLQQAEDNKTITHLITVSCTGMYAPGIDIDLVERMGLNRNTERICINFMGCYGAVNALKTADYICRADQNARVLIVSVELCTLHFQKTNTTENWIANSLFSDGAAAVLVEPFLPGKKGLVLKGFYAEYIHDARDEMGWFVGDTGFEMKLTGKVPKQIKKHIRSVSEKLAAKSAHPLNGHMRYVIHPGGKKILEAAQEAFGFSPQMNDEACNVLREYGNMSSATLLFVLKKMWQKGLQPDEALMAFAFGPGLTVESMLLINK